MNLTTYFEHSVRLYILILFSLLFSSCLAMGVPYTSDPDTLVDYSYEMMNQHRPERAREFIERALDKFEKTDDKEGLAETYMVYGLYHKYKFYVPVTAPLDTSRHPDYSTRRPYTENIDYDKSEEYYRKAIENFQDVNNYEGLSRAYAVLATLYQLKNQKDLMLASIDKSEEYYSKMKVEDSNTESLLELEKSQTLPDFLQKLRQEAATLK